MSIHEVAQLIKQVLNPVMLIFLPFSVTVNLCFRLLELDREAREHAERQKRKVLQELWAMHHGGGGETTRPRSANAMYDYKSKSKYDHLVYPDREKSKFHDRCDDSDWRPEKKAWVP